MQIQAYQIQIYRNSQKGSPTSGTLIKECTVSGTASKAGYHTVKLSDATTIASGETFTIRITFLANGANAYALYEGESSPSEDIYFNSMSGQSYICLTSEGDIAQKSGWQDTVSYKDSESNKIITEQLNNVCIKGFSNAISQEEYNELNPDNSSDSTNTNTDENQRRS